MVDYEVGEIRVLVEFEDEDLADLLLQKYLDRQNDLAQASAS